MPKNVYIHMVGGALTLVVCILFVLLWLIVVIVCVSCVAGPGKYGMLGHGPGSPRSRGVVFGTTRKTGGKKGNVLLFEDFWFVADMFFIYF